MMALLGIVEDAPQAWHIDPKDKDPRDETARVQAFIRDARIVCPAVDIVAVPNAGKRTRWEQWQRAREGMRKGALDLFCTWPGGVAFMEWKDGREMPDANQVDRLNMYVRQGHFCGVFRQERSALAALRRWGAPFIVREGL